MNSVSLIGNLASDVDLRELSDDKKVANFLLAVGRGGRDAGADFVGVSVWDRQGEASAQDLPQGQSGGGARYPRRPHPGKGGRRRRRVGVVGPRGDVLR